MHGYDVKKNLYENCETHSPWVSSGPRAVLIWSYSLNALNLRSFFYSHIYILENKTKKPYSLIVKFAAPGSEVQTLRQARYGNIVKMY